MGKTYDVVILGAGSAGLAARRDVAAATENYLVIDPGPLGTTCARVGCMPSKALIEAAEIYHQRTKFEAIGAESPEIAIDGRKVMRHVRRLRDRFVESVVDGMDEWRSTHLRSGSARFTGPNTVQVGNDTIVAKKFIIATGSIPTVPKPWREIKGLNTTDDFFEIETLPKSMIVIGTGAIGLEIGHALARLNVKVIAIGELKVFANITDPVVRDSAIKTLGREMELIDDQVKTIGIGGAGYRVTLKDRTVEAERVLVAIGRTPRLEGLNLEATGAKLDDKGMPEYSDTTFRIPNTDCYITGDVNKLRPILHEAVDQGRIAALNSVANEDREFARKTNLSIIFTHPNIALIGQTHAQLTKSGKPFVIGDVSFVNQGRAVAKLENAGDLRLYASPEDGKLLGAELFAPEGEHLAHQIAWAIEANRSVFCFLANPFYHPVLEEGLRTALKKAAREISGGPDRLREMRCDDPPAG